MPLESPPREASAASNVLLAEGLEDWVCELDEAGRILWSSERSFACIGHRAGEVVGRSWTEALALPSHPDSVEPEAPGGLKQAVQAALQLRTPCTLRSAPIRTRELLWPSSEGGSEERERRWHLRLIPISSGSTWAVARDIGGALRVEAELAHRTEVLDLVRRFGRVGVWEREIHSGKGRWDETVFRLFGFDPSDGTPAYPVAAQRVSELHTSVPTFMGPDARLGDYQARYSVRLPSGVERVLRSQWAVIGDLDGRPSRTIGVMSDETELDSLSRSFGVMTEQLRLAAEMAAVGLWVHDLTTDRIFYNDQLSHMAGRAPAPQGMTLAEVRDTIHPDDVSIVQASVEKALSSREPVDFEARYRRVDGSWRHVLSRRVVQRGPNDRPVAFLGVSIDVTEQVAQRQRTQDLSVRLDQITETAGVGIWRRDLVTDEAEWNAQLFRIFDLDMRAGAPDRASWLARVHPEDRLAALDGMRRAWETPGRGIECKFRIVRGDGEIRWLDQRATCTTSPSGTPQLSGITLDVTERARAEQALRAATDRAALAARAAGVGTWSMDCLTGEGLWDEQMFRLRGLPPGGPTPDRAGRLALVHPEDRHLFVNGDGMPDPAEGEGASYEFRVVWPDGQVRWLASRSRQVLNAAGQSLSRVGVNWDVTERRAAEQVREQREAALRESQAKSAFLARMSHELRTPLNAVLGFTQLLQRDLSDAPAPQRLKLDHIHSAGEHLLALINDVLDLTHLEAGSLTLDLQPLSVASALDQALPLVQAMAERRPVRIRRTEDEIRVLADPIRLRQILVNVLSNAIKYNRPGGEVSIRTECSNGRSRITISDEGRGIAPDLLKHLFEPFNRLGVQSRDVEGSGIGLVIVKALCEAMQGKIQIRSLLGAGTHVTIELPAGGPAGPDRSDPGPSTPERAGPAQGSSSPHLAPAPSMPGTGTVLYIEDNPVNVLLMRELIETRTQLTLHVAETGERGLHSAMQLRPDLVLVDMQLPDMNGHDVLKRLRQQKVTRDLHCVALSANAMKEDIDRALAAGFEDYWTKPIDFSAFLQALRRRFPPA